MKMTETQECLKRILEDLLPSVDGGEVESCIAIRRAVHEVSCLLNEVYEEALSIVNLRNEITAYNIKNYNNPSAIKYYEEIDKLEK